MATLLAMGCENGDNLLRNGDLIFVGLPADYDADAAVERAKSLCGRQYDVRFLPENEAFYCSELVQACYLDAHGKPVFQSEPMNWLAPDGTMPTYWEQLFRGLGMEVPQGVPGTNPQKMAQAEFLIEVLGL